MKSLSAGRNSSIELLRIIASIGVVFLHYNHKDSGGGFKWIAENSLNQYYLFFIESLCIIAVNLFIMISAYYLSQTQKRKFSKVIELLLQVIIFRAGFYVADCLMGSCIFSIKGLFWSLIPVNYYIVLYSALYIISPYINICLNKLTLKQLKQLVITVMILFSVWTILVDLLTNKTGNPFNGLSTIGMYGSQFGYSIVNFSVVYIIGAYLARKEHHTSQKKSALIVLALTAAIFIGSVVEKKLGFGDTTSWNYNNPLVIVLAAYVLVIFLQWDFQCKIINELSGASLTCFLLHGMLLPYVHVAEIANRSLPILILHQLATGIGLFLLSYAVYKLYSLCTGWFIRLITPLCDRVHLTVVEEGK